jgi:hypothetical protein
MISDELVSLETAKLAKEKGFNWLCSSVKIETIEGSEREVYDEEECRYVTVKDVAKTRIPTQTRLQRWLREEKAILVEVFIDDDSNMPLTYNIHQYKDWNWECVCHHHGNYYAVNSWELCLEDALKYALENLV